jgi:amidase
MRDDPLRAFMPYPPAVIRHAARGPLEGLALAVKDLYDVKGYPTSAGNPHVLALSGIKTRTAPLVRRLLKAGARFVGKTKTDELAFSMTGHNAHYGTPLNSAAPDRIPGGSSSGSAAAVAGGAADIGLGSDTGGSIRAPASYCGLFGLRPTHGALSLEGAFSLAPSFDTAGYMTRDAATFARVARVLLGGRRKRRKLRFFLARDLFALAEPASAAALLTLVSRALLRLGAAEDVILGGDSDARFQAFRHIQAYEAWQSDGDLITRHGLMLGSGVAERFAFGKSLRKADLKPHDRVRRETIDRLENLLGEDGVLIMPSVPGPAPLLVDGEATLNAHRIAAQKLLCLAGLSGSPQVALPATRIEDAPIGLSLLGPRGADFDLVDLAGAMTDAMRPRFAADKGRRLA